MEYSHSHVATKHKVRSKRTRARYNSCNAHLQAEPADWAGLRAKAFEREGRRGGFLPCLVAIINTSM